jgi:quinol monooxygenase YgiN
MSGPIVFISRSAVRPGQLGAFREAAAEMVPSIERAKPGTVVFLGYASEEGAELHMVHVFPDDAAMADHLEGVDERFASVVDLIEPRGYEIFGEPGELVLATMRRFAEALDIPLRVHPDLIGGYVRPAPG